MKPRILFVERKASQFVSIEKAFRKIAENLSDDFDVEFQQVPYGNRIGDTIRNLLSFRKNKADIYHITGHIHYIALLFSPRNTILSIMDVRFLYIKPGLRRWLLKKLYLDLPVKRIKYITAISEQTKREIVHFTGCDEDKIWAIDLPLTVSTVEDEKEFNSARPVILQVGTMENKNIPNLARALKGIKCKLRIIGRLSGDQTTVLSENGVEYENAVDLSDDEMKREYKNADLVAFCSIYEGFGLPIIEAQAMRKPVITSNVSPMIETSGGAAFLADPTDFASIRDGIQKIIGDETYRERLIKAGLVNVRRFAPETTAGKYEELYTTVLSAAGIE